MSDARKTESVVKYRPNDHEKKQASRAHWMWWRWVWIRKHDARPTPNSATDQGPRAGSSFRNSSQKPY
ncbi:hypothetical protein BM221_005017 [Beauveria bassiana]|uniref:Uncharacterized protein n=1 Tax=Beauveria bassiana TaxID=176275 RepID=A0A2N6NME4_BEABA|nr:hypothetical protein BM221_005017 [Beauveria bassiana]